MRISPLLSDSRQMCQETGRRRSPTSAAHHSRKASAVRPRAPAVRSLGNRTAAGPPQCVAATNRASPRVPFSREPPKNEYLCLHKPWELRARTKPSRTSTQSATRHIVMADRRRPSTPRSGNAREGHQPTKNYGKLIPKAICVPTNIIHPASPFIHRREFGRFGSKRSDSMPNRHYYNCSVADGGRPFGAVLKCTGRPKRAAQQGRPGLSSPRRSVIDLDRRLTPAQTKRRAARR